MLLSEREENSILSAWAVEGRFGDVVAARLLMADRLLLRGGSLVVWGEGPRPRPRTSLPRVTAAMLKSQ